MKSPMLKLDLLIAENEKTEITRQLQEIGLLHLEELGEAGQISSHQDYKEWLELKNWLDKQPTESYKKSDLKLEKPLLPQLGQVKDDWHQWQHEKEEFEQSQNFWRIWGGYQAEIWDDLKKTGLALALYKGDKKDYQAYADRVFLLNQDGQDYYFFAIDLKDRIEQINLEAEKLPPLKQAELLEMEIELSRKKEHLNVQIEALKAQGEELEREAESIVEKWEFNRGTSLWQSFEHSPLTHLRAWVPKRKIEDFKQKCKSLPLAYRVLEPSKKDRVPIELKNDSYSRLFEPITRIFQLPHYYEFDLSPLIAVFYPILFAYCLGDAGYGAIMTLAVVIGWFSFLKKQRSLAALVGILGISTTIMGLIKSGSLFGVPLTIESDNSWIAALGQLVLIPDNSDFFFNAFNVALLIGVLQILIGIILAIAKEWYYNGFKESLSLWGKLLIVSSLIAIFMSDSLNLNELSLNILNITLILGIALIMLFHDLSQGLIVRLGSSILPLFFIFTGLLGDVLSYVRLFALGVTSAVLGLVVNQIGMDMVSEHWWSWIGVALFLLFGHGLNFVLAALGSFIHPLRLTFVEFYNNAQFEGGGKAFNAFRKKNKSLN